MHTHCAQFQLIGVAGLSHGSGDQPRSGTTFVQSFLNLRVITEPMLRLSLDCDTHVLVESWWTQCAPTLIRRQYFTSSPAPAVRLSNVIACACARTVVGARPAMWRCLGNPSCACVYLT